MTDTKKCFHPSCTCAALPLADYCCVACKVAHDREVSGEDPLAECHCHHADCGGETEEVPADVQGLLLASEVLAS